MSNWKHIDNFSRYSINESGMVRNDNTGKLIAHNENSTGYKRVSLYSDNARKYKQCLLHRLLAVAFIDNIYNLEVVDHIDMDKLNNNLDNLQWVTKAENTQRAYDLGKNPNRKLTPTDRKVIKRIMETAIRGTQAKLAKKYNVHTSRIKQITNDI